MADEGFKRKLTAILSADVAGYSRLMAEDETATVKTIASYREIMASLIKQHRGRVVDSPGDNLLAEFSSVVDAVQCAVAVQNEFQTRNAELAENRRMEFRIGINLGDVIDEEGRIYGDGVNISARLEALADPGGICVSKTAFDQIETKLPLGYEYLGEQPVKNIPKPVGAYRVLMKPDAVGKVIGEKRFLGRYSRRTAMAAIIILVMVAVGLISWNIYLHQSKRIEPASLDKMAYPLPDKPSIAVLPFDNMTGDPEQEYIADGITENIITALSKISEMFVIARNSTFTYKAKPVKINQVSEELGVRYVLEGSVQKEDDRVRITAQLIDATTGHHLWSERYDRDLKSLFALLDEITKEIVTALDVKLSRGEQARIWYHGTDNFEAWENTMRGVNQYWRYTKESVAKAREHFKRAVDLDPNYSWAWTMLAWTHLVDARMGYSQSPVESFKRGDELAQKALALNDSDPEANAQIGRIYLTKRQYDKAIATGKKAIALGPSNAYAHFLLGQTLFYAGKFEEAIPLFQKAMRLEGPYMLGYNLLFLGISYHMLGRNEEALPVFKKFLEFCRKGQFPEFVAHMNLAAVNIELGRVEEAHKHVSEVLRLNPKFSLEWIRRVDYFKDPAHLEQRLEPLRRAGLPE
jgi:adenylate cyclase